MSRFRKIVEALVQACRLAVGQGSYRAYREHMATYHAGLECMDERTFFRQRQEARYHGKGGTRCC